MTSMLRRVAVFVAAVALSSVAASAQTTVWQFEDVAPLNPVPGCVWGMHQMILRPADGNTFLVYRDVGSSNEKNT